MSKCIDLKCKDCRIYHLALQKLIRWVRDEVVIDPPQKLILQCIKAIAIGRKDIKIKAKKNKL